MLPILTAEATVVADPEVRFSPSGQAWSRLRLVCNDRVRDATGQWVDGEPLFFTGVVFGKQAENLAESVLKGDRVVVSGRAKMNEWETEQGEKRRDLQVVIDSVAVSVLFGPAKTDRIRGEALGGGRAAPAMDVSRASDPFGAPAPAAAPVSDPFGGGWPGPQSDMPPF